MGHESKANPQATENVGRFNVIITLTDLDGEQEIISAKSWHHNNDYLALNVESDHLRIIVLRNYKYYDVAPQARVVT